MQRATTTPSDLPIGRIAGLFGIRGELKCDPTQAGRHLFVPGAVLRCEVEGESRSIVLKSEREHKGRLLLTLEDVTDANAATAYLGGIFFAPRDRLDVAPEEYLDTDLIGCAVVAADGKSYGLVESVEHHPANDTLIVAGRMLPMVGAFIQKIDLTHKHITVTIPPGLLDDP